METQTLLEKAKANLMINFDADDLLISNLIAAAVNYAEDHQHLPSGYYDDHSMPATTEQAIIMLVTLFYESRDGTSGGFWNNGTPSAGFDTINRLLVLDREWHV